MKKLAFALAFIASFLLIFAILFTSLQLCMNDEGYFRDTYEKMEIEKFVDIPTDDVTRALMQLIDYMEGRVDSIQLTVTENGREVEMYNERETLHMLDVRELYQTWRGARDFAVPAVALLLIAACALLARGERLNLLARAFLIAAASFMGLLAVFAIFAAIDFNTFWTAFHLLFFDNDLWLLSYETDRMIRICPLELFSGIIGRFALLFLLPFGALLGAALGALSYHKRKA